MLRREKLRNPVPARNVRLARELWPGQISDLLVGQLRKLVGNYGLSLMSGDIQLLNGKWYITHSGLLRHANQQRCFAICVDPVTEFCDISARRWAFKATVFKSRVCKGFVGYGDADPSNVAPLVHGAEMRIAETRAVNRAIRKAYGIGICSVEELSSSTSLSTNRVEKKSPTQPVNGNGWNGGPKVRDRLCQLIRQHQLDATLVKAYAVEFCGTKSLREATREQVENFVQHLADWAEKDRNALLCQLNSYLGPKGSAA